MNRHNAEHLKRQASEVQSIHYWQFLRELLGELNKLVDRRLEKTLIDLVQIILINRHHNNGLLLSELGDQLLGGNHRPAGTKRISHLIHSLGWMSTLIDGFCGNKAVSAWQPY